MKNIRSLKNKVKNKYTDDNYPEKNISSALDSENIKTFKYDDLPDEEVWGMLYSLNRDDNGELQASFQNPAHTLVVGTTQVGKTWSHVINSIFTLSQKKNRANMFITDPKGELFANTARHLKKRGYKIFALNFKDSFYSNMWNPLLPIYDVWMEQTKIREKIQFHPTLEGIEEYDVIDEVDEFATAGCFWSYEKKAFSSGESVEEYAEGVRGSICETVSSEINRLVDSIGAEYVEKAKDPIWERGALEILKGFIYLMLEDALDSRSGFKRENMNFFNLRRYYSTVRAQVLKNSSLGTLSLSNSIKLRHKNATDNSMEHLRGYFENAPVTARSYMGVFENIMQNWFNVKMFSLTNTSNVDLGNFDEEPFAVFLITNDYEKSDYHIAGLFIDWLYGIMVKKADENGGKLSREMFFILDEFANIPVISGFENKISTALSRRIIFQLYVQSYEQIETNYGQFKAETIKANCNVEIFFGSQSFATKKLFSEKCGIKRIESVSSVLCPDNVGFTEIPLLPINSLENLGEGDAYMKRLNRPVFKTHFERSYKCKELFLEKASFKEIGIFSKRYNDKIFVYRYLENELSMDMYNIERLTKREGKACYGKQ